MDSKVGLPLLSQIPASHPEYIYAGICVNYPGPDTGKTLRQYVSIDMGKPKIPTAKRRRKSINVAKGLLIIEQA